MTPTPSLSSAARPQLAGEAASEGRPSSPSNQAINAFSILRLSAVLQARGRSRSTHYTDIAQGLFTRPVKVGARAVGWPAQEVVALNEARIAGQSDEEIRALVTALESQRKARG